MLQIHQVSKRYGDRQVLEDISFVVNQNDRLGLVGPNGSGKTSLLRLLCQEEQPDNGQVLAAPGTSIGYLPQGITFADTESAEAALWAGIPGYAEARAAINRLGHRLHTDGALAEYAVAYERFEALGGYEIEAQIAKAADRMGLSEDDLRQPVTRLSGGQQTRLGLARLLLGNPNLLLLDEPTNHLDIGAIEWLEAFLDAYQGALIVVSHDRVFLDNTVNALLVLTPGVPGIRLFHGSYTQFEATRAQELAAQWAAWKDQIEQEGQLDASIRQISDRATRYEHISKNDFQRRKARMVMRKASAQKTRLRRQLDAVDRVEKPRQKWGLKVSFDGVLRGGQEALRLEGLGHRYRERWLFKDLDLVLRHGERVALVGPNGSGKSTLLNLIAGELASAAGRVVIGPSIKVGYMPQQIALPPDGSPLETILRSSRMTERDARNFLHLFLFSGDDVFGRLDQLSYGQRARLMLARLIAGGANCLVLDEPLNHLDMESKESFMDSLEGFPGAILVAIHDRAFISRFAGQLWKLEGGSIRQDVPLAAGANLSSM